MTRKLTESAETARNPKRSNPRYRYPRRARALSACLRTLMRLLCPLVILFFPIAAVLTIGRIVPAHLTLLLEMSLHELLPH